MGERGSALMVSVIGIGILLLISGVLYTSVISSYRLETSEEKALKAYYLAEAGIQNGIFQIITENDKVNQNKVTEKSITQTISEPYEGMFHVNWRENDTDPGIFSIQSEGTYEGISRKLEVEYSLSGS